MDHAEYFEKERKSLASSSEAVLADGKEKLEELNNNVAKSKELLAEIQKMHDDEAATYAVSTYAKNFDETKESYDESGDNDAAVSKGVRLTAGQITSAAAIMVGVFSTFALARDVGLQQFGVGLGVAVLIDATVIRSVLLPATMKLLGDWNWYLPGWLEWLPKASTAEGAHEDTQPAEEAGVVPVRI